MGVAEGWLGKSSNSKIVLGPADKSSEEVQPDMGSKRSSTTYHCLLPRVSYLTSLCLSSPIRKDVNNSTYPIGLQRPNLSDIGQIWYEIHTVLFLQVLLWC